ncbi:MAG TPA: ribonuclease III [Candidatus Methanoperedens sp.]|nr:ribonuclease III [Candidatus Methanoperedens sp.]
MTEKEKPEEMIKSLEERLGHRFRRPELLAAALTHRSAAVERPGEAAEDNERLEFLGDAVLGLAAARHLAAERPGAREGELSRLRAALVGETALAAAARDLGLGESLRFGRGEERSGGREKPSILAGALEALVGALFLDAGWRSAYRFARAIFRGPAGTALAADGGIDAKTRLQEYCQRRWRETPVYAVLERSGPAHSPRFVVEALLGGRTLGRGEGGSRKGAEQAAAAAALAGAAAPEVRP